MRIIFFSKMSVNERIQSIIDRQYNGNKSAFSKAINVGATVIQNIVGTRKGKPSYDVIKSICANANISADWLLTGNGSMLKSDQPDSNYTPLTNNKTKETLLDVAEIPLYNIEASAGLSKLFANGGELLGSIKIPNAPRCDGAVYVIGDSMYPLLKAGDIIAYRQVYNLESIVYGEIYLIQLYNEGDLSVVIKYVKRSEKGDTYIKLVSYNKEHDPKDIPLSWVQSIARVTFSIRKFSIT